MRTQTNQQLQEQIHKLEVQVSSLQRSKTRLSDEVLELKTHYSNLIESLNERFKVIIDNVNNEFEIVRDKVQKIKR